jgi:FlaA1/EpsC-like NDP-sugar epimerase
LRTSPPGPVAAGWLDRVLSHLQRNTPLALVDLAITCLAYLATLVLRFEGDIPEEYWSNFRIVAPAIAAVHVLTNHVFGLYGEVWRFASVREARRVAMSAATAGAVLLAADVALLGSRPLPWSVVAFGAVLSLIGFGAVRFQSRLFAFRRRVLRDERKRVLLVGAGKAADMVLRDVLHNPSIGIEPVGIVDDDPRKVGRLLHEVPILGPRDVIPVVVPRLRVDQVLLAIPSATSEVVREVAALCEEAGVRLRVLPSVHEFVDGRVQARGFRDLKIEDLLGRQQVTTDLEAVANMIRGRRVLVTGGGGSIGSEIARQVVAFEPEVLVLLDHDETHLHDVQTALEGKGKVEVVLADIRDQDRVVWAFLEHRPDVVFHAAAHKHVPLLETHPAEAVLTNVIGTANVMDAALAAGTGRFVLISTDKAVNPASIMGASKWYAEQIVRSFQGSGPTLCAVRFGNVLGSRGSVIPTFLRQIELGGPVTVTDPTMTRFFMSIEEAVQLVLQAAALSEGGEVFTLEMGEPVNILDLARRVIRLSGHVPGKDIEIAIVGVRPGEKLAEEVIDLTEDPMPTVHPGIVVARPPIPDRVGLRRALRELEVLANEGRIQDLADRMRAVGGQRRPMVQGTAS